MLIGVLKEIKSSENRVAITPAGVEALEKAGHQVIIQSNAGMGSGITNDDYMVAGAAIVECAEDIWAKSDMIMKVEEPLSSEYDYFRKDLMLFTYLNLSTKPELIKALMNKSVLTISYEIVHLEAKGSPIYTPITSSFDITNYTLPYVMEIANKGAKQAIKDNKILSKGVDVANRRSPYETFTKDRGFKYVPVKVAL